MVVRREVTNFTLVINYRIKCIPVLKDCIIDENCTVWLWRSVSTILQYLCAYSIDNTSMLTMIKTSTCILAVAKLRQNQAL